MGRNASEDEIREIRGGQRFFKNKKNEDETLLECEIEIERKDYKYKIYEKEKRIRDVVDGKIIESNGLEVLEINTKKYRIKNFENVTLEYRNFSKVRINKERGEV